VTGGEDELIKRAQRGDSDALCALAESYQRRIYAIARQFCRDQATAEDLSQEVWLKAFKSLQSFRGQASFYTWLRHIAVNTFLDHQRKAKYRQRDAGSTGVAPMENISDHTSSPATAIADVEEALHRKIFAAKVADALARLPPRQRLMLLLKHQDGMTYEEIADIFGCSAGTVKKALYRALTRLRRSLSVEPRAESKGALCAGEEVCSCGR
jgi:RNA polymerase sigma-70 factor (ECF subfamily)